VPPADVPDAQYFAADISDYERNHSVFIEIPAGGDAVHTMVDVVDGLRELGGKVQRLNNGPNFP